MGGETLMKIKSFIFALVESKYRPTNELPHLEDMLRYDSAFQDVSDPQQIMFPMFKTKTGTFGGKITYGRWDSFGVRIRETNRPNPFPIDHAKWVTYHRDVQDKLVPITLEEFLRTGALR
jgi:hypothetical protein